MLGICLDNVRKTVPLVHNITNYVTVNDVANILLACGGSPIMSDEPEDVEDITSICGGLNINIGTLNQRSIQAMLRAGKKAAQLHHVLLLDPVGAGAAAVCAMGLAGETGWSRMAPGDGNSTYRNRIIDAIYNMDGAALDKGAKYEVR